MSGPHQLLDLLGQPHDGASPKAVCKSLAVIGPVLNHAVELLIGLFFREDTYPWKSPEDDLSSAEKLINDCGYHRRDEELADAKLAILGG